MQGGREAETQAPPALAEQVGEQEWYHTLELAPGIVTPGWFDLRKMAASVPLPVSLSGKRCLDIGTFDGFWAFEMERRGADQVVAIDILDPEQWDWPANVQPAIAAAIAQRKGRGEGFAVARKALGSRVERHELSVYDVATAGLGEFDVVYFGSLLLHLRDPIGALMRVRTICRETLVVVDAVDLWRSLVRRHRAMAFLDGVGRPWWWKPNVAGLARMVEAAGFKITAGPTRLFMPAGPGQPLPKLRPAALLSHEGRAVTTIRLLGDPHAALAATPVDSP